MTKYPRGSLWNKWDLHVHTPASIVGTSYGDENKNETWEKYLTALENLPQEFKVLGINDYIFIDGYRRLLNEKNAGRLKNIDTLLPVVELRLDKFGGTESKLSRVNFHIIFSEELTPDQIEQQFLNALRQGYKLSPQYASAALDWNGLITKESLADLGEKIIQSVPEQERHNFKKALVEGFNNLNISLETISKALDNHLFKDKYLTSVGKSEWWNIKWNEQSIADKKHIVQNANFLFIAAENPDTFLKAKQSLSTSNVNDQLLDCSDAHHYSNSKEKDRIGNSFTWINADPTFGGLFHAFIEYESRVFVGEIPPLLERVENLPTKYIDSIEISRVNGASLKEKWFESEKLLFNPGLVAIIGNKGNGKSALADIVGLASSSTHYSSFSFLNKDKFLKLPENKGSNFEAHLNWQDNKKITVRLDEAVDLTQVERTNYIPQSYFEEITNELGGADRSTFDEEISKVIYSHVPENEKLGYDNLNDLLSYKTSVITERLTKLRNQLAATNSRINDLEILLFPSHKRALQNQLRAKNAEIKAHKARKIRKPTKPKGKSATLEAEITKAKTKRDALKEQVEKAKSDLGEVTKKLAAADKVIQKLQSYQVQHEEFADEIESDLAFLGMDMKLIVNLQIDFSVIEKTIAKFKTKKAQLLAELNTDRNGSKTKLLKEWENKLVDLNKQSGSSTKIYHQTMAKIRKWETDLEELVGNSKRPGTQKFLEASLSSLNDVPIKVSNLYKIRLEQTEKIFGELAKIKNIYAEFYAPVQDFVEIHPDISEKIEVTFDASIVNLNLVDQLYVAINRAKKGSFFAGAAGTELTETLIKQTDFNDLNQTLNFINEILKSLQQNTFAGVKAERIKNQLRTGKSVKDLYNLLFSLDFLQPKYLLKMGRKELSQLSPGERGALLLVFFLLVDKSSIPLVIDQPEHNLDNQTVVNLLVPAIKKAKQTRQIIIVTHSPNLAVVCDADQIIWAELSIKDNHSLRYNTGSLEDPKANQVVVDILEGTWRSFVNRGKKYYQPILN